MQKIKVKIFNNEEQMKRFIIENKTKIKKYKIRREMKESENCFERFRLIYFEEITDKIMIKDLLINKPTLKNEIDETLDHITGELHLLKDYDLLNVNFFNRKIQKVINDLYDILEILKNNSKNII